MRKPLVLLIITIIILLLSSLSVEAKFDFAVNGFYYRVVSLEKRTCALVNEREGENQFPVSTYRGNIIVPSTVTVGQRTFTVVEIGEYAFYTSKVISVKIPSTIKVIGRSAFADCEELQSIEIEDGVEIIGDYAFLRCGRQKHITKFNMPTSSIKSIGRGAFKEIQIAKEANACIVVPSSCNSVGMEAFAFGDDFKLIIQDSNLPLTVYDDGLKTSNYIYVGRDIEYKMINYFDGTGRLGIWNAMSIVFGNYVSSIPKWERQPSFDMERDTLIFGKSIKSIPQIYFSKIDYIQVNAINPPEMAGFENNVYVNSVLAVPEGTINKYKNDPSWGKFWEIKEVDVSTVKPKVGTIVFGNSYILKAINDSSVFWSEEEHTTPDGYMIMRSYGGDIIPFKYLASGKYGFVDKKGRIVVEPKFDDYMSGDYTVWHLVPVYITDDKRIIRDKQGYIDESYCLGFINLKGDLIVPCLYSTIYTSNDSMPELVEFNDAWPLKSLGNDGPFFGAINKQGKIVAPFEYDGFNSNEDGTLSFFKGQKEYVYDENWKIDMIKERE